jgi:SpoVK/Ycf46/Vps4 family AAA+-type ATPase
VIEIE